MTVLPSTHGQLGPGRRGWVFRLLTVCGALLLCLLGLELVLRLGGFRYELRVSVLEST